MRWKPTLIKLLETIELLAEKVEANIQIIHIRVAKI